VATRVLRGAIFMDCYRIESNDKKTMLFLTKNTPKSSLQHINLKILAWCKAQLPSTQKAIGISVPHSAPS
jgi:hypothetical protein